MAGKKSKRIFISDIHMGDSRSVKTSSANPYEYGWFADKEGANQNRPKMLADFLEKYVINDGTVEELVVLGDLFDEWVCPANISPIEPHFANQWEVIANASQNNKVFSHLKKIARTGRLIYVTGNHDMLSTEHKSKETIEGILPGVRYLGKDGLGTYESDDGILIAQRGHKYCLFNSPWIDTSGSTGFESSMLPMGFDIARLDAQFFAQKGHGYNLLDFIWDAIKDIFIKKGLELELFSVVEKHEAFSKEISTLIDEAIIDGFKCFYSDNVFKNQSGIVYDGLDDVPGTVIWEAIDNRYSNIFSQWEKFHPKNVSALRAMINDMGYLESGAKYLMQHQKCKIVIFGHTHIWKFKTLQENSADFDEESKPTAHQIYANSGTWINAKPCTFVKTESDGNKHTVSVWKYEDNKIHQLPNSCSSIEIDI